MVRMPAVTYNCQPESKGDLLPMALDVCLPKRTLAGPVARRVEGHLRDAAYVVADCGQGHVGADTADQPFLGYFDARHGARSHDPESLARQSFVQDGVRFHWPPALHSNCGRRSTSTAAQGLYRGGLLP